MSTLIEINDAALNNVTGGTVNKNPTPGKINDMDSMFNGKNYDQIASLIAAWLSRNDSNTPYCKRTRNVNNNVDIYDISI
ncbi:MAG: hypothetical protein MJ110_00975 [Lachnospiraceae bacterium]|nr:hypothetical protein [Lachnospiraceae bacterium]